MLKPRPTIAGRRLNVIVSRETLDRLRVATVDDTSINTRNTPHAFTAAVPVPHRRPGQRCVMINVSLRACNAPNVAHPWTSPGLGTQGPADPSVPPQRSHQNAPYIPRCSRYAHGACRPTPPSGADSNRPPPPARDRQATSSPHPESAQLSERTPSRRPRHVHSTIQVTQRLVPVTRLNS